MHIHVFDELLAKQLTRKEFLVHLGVLLFAITGISSVLKTLSDPHVVNKHLKPNAGFGMGRYGG